MNETTDPHVDAEPTAARRAVVIGGAGFLGRRLVTLISGGDGALEPRPEWPRFDAVHVVDRTAYVEENAARSAREGRGVELTSTLADVCSKEELRAALRGAHTVFHLASVVDVGLRENPAIEAVNVVGTRNVVEVCEELGVPFLVYTSSEDVVFAQTPRINGDESIPYPEKPLLAYVKTKIEGERAVRAADGRRGLRTCAIRPLHIYGPQDPHAIVQALEAFAARKVPFLFGDGSARFGCVYVDNVVHAHLLAAARLHDPSTRDGVAGEAYFVGEGFAPNFFEFIRPFADARGIPMPRLRLPNRGVYALAWAMELVHRLTGIEVPFHRYHYHALAKDFFFSSDRAARELGYEPLVSCEEGMARTVEWIRVARLGGS